MGGEYPLRMVMVMNNGILWTMRVNNTTILIFITDYKWWIWYPLIAVNINSDESCFLLDNHLAICYIAMDDGLLVRHFTCWFYPRIFLTWLMFFFIATGPLFCSVIETTMFWPRPLINSGFTLLFFFWLLLMFFLWVFRYFSWFMMQWRHHPDLPIGRPNHLVWISGGASRPSPSKSRARLGQQGRSWGVGSWGMGDRRSRVRYECDVTMKY